MGFGTGDLGDFISNGSFRGFLFEYRYRVTPNVAAGIDLSWNVFYERMDYSTYSIDTRSLSGVQYRYSNEFPMLISFDYFFKPDSDFNPYAGLGIGTIYSLRNTDMGLYTLEEDAWHFALKPEAGFIYSFSPYIGFKLGAKYYHGFKAGDLESQSYISISSGLAFKF
jgi:outer membrane protein